jgi:hypothetical protein
MNEYLRIVWWSILAGAVLLAAAIAGPAIRSDAVTIGASGGPEADLMSRNIGHQLPTHRYGQLAGTPITNAHYVNISFGDWASIRSQDSNIRRWARALRDTHTTRLVSLDHEPMTDLGDGTPEQYKEAARYIVNLFRAEGATNVRIVWAVTWVSIRNGVHGVHAYYPGRRWVDYVSSNVFNRPSVHGWQSFPELAAPLLELGERYGKRVVVSEWASDASPNRAHWIGVAGNYMHRHRAAFAAAYYFPGRYVRFDFALSTAAEYAAMRTLVGKVTP